MKKKWSSLFYTFTIAGAAAAIYWILKQGKALQDPVLTNKEILQDGQTAAHSYFQEFTGSFSTHISEPIAVLLLQIIVIILFARLFGFLFKKIGQPAVIGEIVAG
ncbi:MAG TPA: cation/H(+) antiporter, partial [Ferruginibacter sp.]|nr:cation/H(+) antiporter [Ferruginibacter sp.]